MEKSLLLLQELGFNPKEIEVYLLLLESGTTQASTLARRLRMPTSTAQYACQQLTKKGLLRMVQKGNRYLFSAEPPSKLSAIVEKDIENLQRKQASLDSVIAELESKVNPESVMPKLKFFEGHEGVVEAYKELMRDIEPGSTVLNYVEPVDESQYPHKLDKVLEDVNKEFMRKKVNTKVLAPFSPLILPRYQDREKHLEDFRFIERDSFECTATEIAIFNNKVYFLTADQGNIFSTIMESKGIAAMQRTIFEMLWDSAEAHHLETVKKLKK